MTEKLFLTSLVLSGFLSLVSCKTKDSVSPIERVISSVEETEIARAKAFLVSDPVTVTGSYCERSAGGIHDFFSEGDYWWPDPANPDGPYIRRDGQTNQDQFKDHRLALMRMSEMVATLTSAWLLTSEPVYADKAWEHLNAWFVDEATLMNPHMLYAQAITGRVTGRGVGLIDAYHFVEVIRCVKILSEKGGIPESGSEKIKQWFGRFLTFMTTHEYGIDEMNRDYNNHGTCWVATAGSMAALTQNREVIELCINQFKNILLPKQMAEDGSFPAEIERTKPYGYSLFNIDAFCNVAQILSTPEDNLFEYETADGKSLKKGMEFIYPYVADKSKWPYDKDIYIWEEWPVRHPSLLFGALAYGIQDYLDTYLQLPAYPIHPEVIRNLPVRHPVIWLIH